MRLGSFFKDGNAINGTSVYQKRGQNKYVFNEDLLSPLKVFKYDDMSSLQRSAEKFFEPYGHKLEFTETDSNHIVFSVSGIKNAVLLGQDLWERVQFYISAENSDSNDQTSYFIVSDGFYTGGIGKEPPLSSYTNPFEPKYFQELQMFTGKFGTFIKADLEK